MNTPQKVSVTILTGFLGSGKTSPAAISSSSLAATSMSRACGRGSKHV